MAGHPGLAGTAAVGRYAEHLESTATTGAASATSMSLYRHRNAATCARVTGSNGEYVSGVVPVVMPTPASQSTAGANHASAATSVNGADSSAGGSPAERCNTTAI